jgi:RNA polymerase sigma-70 factor (ECF subfamily)
MNPTPIAGIESQVHDSQAQFLAIYPLARRAAEVRTAAAIAWASLAPADREDWEQEALTAVWRALPRYDPSRASLRTFVERVVTTRFASLLRARRSRPKLEPLEEYHSVGLDGIPVVEFRTDFHRVSTSLAEHDRRLATLLLDHSPTEASRVLRISRSSVYDRIHRIRIAFEDAGFGPRGRRPR